MLLRSEGISGDGAKRDVAPPRILRPLRLLLRPCIVRVRLCLRLRLRGRLTLALDLRPERLPRFLRLAAARFPRWLLLLAIERTGIYCTRTEKNTKIQMYRRFAYLPIQHQHA